jgi:hypothetical protein
MMKEPISSLWQDNPWIIKHLQESLHLGIEEMKKTLTQWSRQESSRTADNQIDIELDQREEEWRNKKIPQKSM